MRGLVRTPGVTPHVDRGFGSCVLLLSGMAAMPCSWEPVVDRLDGHRLLAPVNRGTLPGDEPGRLSIRGLAQDAVRLLDHAGVVAAHVVGNSLGGMIAQELALRHPERVRSLALLSTSTGTLSVPFSPATMLLLGRAMRGTADRRERLLRACLRSAAMAERPPVGGACLGVANPLGARAQVYAAARWTSFGRLCRISAPTLVIHGEEDRLVPAANARLLARRIPRATLELVPGAGHLILDDAPERVGVALARFLDNVKAGLVTEPHGLPAQAVLADMVPAVA